LAAGAGGRGSGSAAVGRARDREVAAYGGADRTDRFGTAHAAALLLLAATWRQRLSSYHRPARAGGGVRPWRRGEGEARQARCAVVGNSGHCGGPGAD